MSIFFEHWILMRPIGDNCEIDCVQVYLKRYLPLSSSLRINLPPLSEETSTLFLASLILLQVAFFSSFYRQQGNPKWPPPTFFQEINLKYTHASIIRKFMWCGLRSILSCKLYRICYLFCNIGLAPTKLLKQL